MITHFFETGEFAHEQDKDAVHHLRQVVSVGKC